MGGPTGFLKGFMGVAQPKLEERRKKREQSEEQERQFLLGMSPYWNELPEGTRENLKKRVKLLWPDKESQGILEKVYQVGEGAVRAMAKKPKKVEAPQMGRGEMMMQAGGAAHEAQKKEATDVEERKQREKLEQIETQGRFKNPAQTQTKNLIGPDGKSHTYALKRDPETGEITKEDLGLAGSSAAGQIRLGKPVTRENALELAKQGRKFPDAEGNDIDIKQLPAGMALSTVVRSNGEEYYLPYTMGQKYTFVGGVRYEIPVLDRFGSGNATALGPVKTPTTTSREQVFINPQTGAAEKKTLGTTTVPSTPGMKGAPQRVIPPEVKTPGVAQAPASPVAAPTKTSTSTSSSSLGSSMPVSMYNQQVKRVTPLREAYSQVFGDPTVPEFRGLSAYGELANKPESAAKVGKALRFFFDNVEAAKPGGVSFWDWVKTESGFTQALAESKQKAMQEVMGDLSQEETEAFNATIDAVSTVVGVRALTSASAAKYSVEQLKNDVPTIGLNAKDAYGFYDKLVRFAEVVRNGVRSTANSMYEENERETLMDLPNRMLKERDKYKKSGAGPQKVTPPSSKSPSSFVWDEKQGKFVPKG